SIIEGQSKDAIIVSDERSWVIEGARSESKIISPTIGVKRTESIVEGILQAYDLSYNICKTVLSKDAHFLYTTEPYNVNLVVANKYKEWYDQKRGLSGSLKGTQLKVMEALLVHSLSNSVRRPEWEWDNNEEDSPFIIKDLFCMRS